MPIVHFNAPATVSAETILRSLSTRVVNTPRAAETILLIGRRTATGGDLGALTKITGTTINAWFHSIGFNATSSWVQWDDDGLASPTGPTVTAAAATDVIQMAITLPATGTAERFHFKNLTTGYVSHAAGSANGGKRAAGDASQVDSIILGGYGDFGPWTGDLIAWAIWDVELTDAQIDECWANRRTSDLWKNSAGNPICLVEGNTLSFVDVAGGSALSQLGTATLTGTDPVWSFDGKGATATPSGTGIGTGSIGGGTIGVRASSVPPSVVGLTGIGTAEAWGSAVAQVGAVSASPAGIASAGAWGAATAAPGAIAATPSGIGSSEAWGAATATLGAVSANPTGVPSGEAWGSATLVVGVVSTAPTGIPSGEAFGSAAVGATSTVTLAGIGSAEAWGTAALAAGAVSASPAGISSAGAFGTTALAPGAVSLAPSGTATAEAWGAATLTRGPVSTSPSGVPSAEVFGYTTVAKTATVQFPLSRLHRGIVAIANSPFTSQSATSLAPHYDWCAFHSPTEAQDLADRDAWKAANPASVTYAYQNWSMAVNDPTWTTSGFTTAQARAAGFLGLYGGVEGQPSGYAGVLTGNDTGKAGFGRAWADNVISRLAAFPGWQGVFVDDVNVGDNRMPNDGVPDGYASGQAYKDAQKAQLQIAVAALNNAGYYTIGNVGGLADVWQGGPYLYNADLAGIADWTFLEFAGSYSNLVSEYNASAGDPDFASQNFRVAIATAYSRGKGSIVNSYGSTQALAEYNEYLARILTEPGYGAASLEGEVSQYASPYPWFSPPMGVAWAAATGTGPTHTDNTPVWSRTLADGTILTANVETLTGTAAGPATIGPGGIASSEAWGSSAVQRGPVSVSPAGIASAGAFGTTTVQTVVPGNVQPLGVASAEAWGSATATRGAVTASPSGVSSAEAFGAAALTAGPVSVTATGIGSAEAWGSATLQRGAVTVTATGVASAEAWGATTATAGAAALAPTGIGSAQAFGAAALTAGAVTVAAAGIASGEAFGAGVVAAAGAQVLAPAGVASAEAWGSAVLQPGAVAVAATGAASGEAWGSATAVPGATSTSPSGITSSSAFGATTVSAAAVAVTPTGIPSAEAWGSTVVVPAGVTAVVPSGIPSAEAWGAAQALAGAVSARPTGIGSAEAWGAPALALTLAAAAIASAEGWGLAQLLSAPVGVSAPGVFSSETWGFSVALAVGPVVVSPTGIPSAQAFGLTLVARQQTLSPTGILSREAFGPVVLTAGAVSAYVVGIWSAEVWGTPLALAAAVVVGAAGVASAEAWGIPSLNFRGGTRRPAPSGAIMRGGPAGEIGRASTGAVQRGSTGSVTP